MGEDDEINGTSASKPVKRNASPLESAAKHHQHASVWDAQDMSNTPGRTNTEDGVNLYDLYKDLEARVRDLESDRELLKQTLKDRDAELLTVRQENADLQSQLCRFPQTPPPGSPDSLDSGAAYPVNPVLETDIGASSQIMETDVSRVHNNSSGLEASRGTSNSGEFSRRPPASPSYPATHPARESAPLHPECEGKAGKLLSSLNNLATTIPKHATTLLLGDSLVHCINKVDFECGDTLRVRSVGGLCIPAFVRALKQRERSLGSIKRVIVSVGVNDYLHKNNHCIEDASAVFRDMDAQTKRVFPKATIFFVLPYKGITKVTSEDIKELQALVKTHCKRFKVFTPPSLVNMVSAGGVHAKNKGAKLLKDFYRKLVPIPQRTFSEQSGRQQRDLTYAATVQHPPPQQVQVDMRPQQAEHQWRRPSVSVPVHQYQGAPPPPANDPNVFPELPRNSNSLEWRIAAAVAGAFQNFPDYRLRYPHIHSGGQTF